MTKESADRIICDYTNKIYGFALSKTGSIERAEELASRITLEVYSSLLKQENIPNPAGYIWKIAMNVRARFTDEMARAPFVLSDNEPEADDFTEKLLDAETKSKLRLEIAYLSRLRRKILILHYYRNMKLADIAKELSLPVGTVKWHLSAARDELREGMTKMRNTGNLGIAPITLTRLSHDGLPGRNGATEYYLKSKLAQNIAWAAYHKPRSISEIADELGTSPVWIEDEVDTLEENGFLDKIGEKYLTNVLIEDPSPEIDIKVHELYTACAKEVAKTYPDRVFEALKGLDRSDIYIPGKDDSLLDWLGIAVAMREKFNTSFDDAAYDRLKVKRPDGGCYIASAWVEKQYDLPFDMRLYTSCGPMRRDTNKYPVLSWQLTTFYDTRKLDWADNRWQDYEYLYEFMTGRITKSPEDIEKYMRLREKGYLTADDEVNIICSRPATWIENSKLWSVIPEPDENERALLDELAEKLKRLVVPRYPEQMRKVAELYNSCPEISMYVIERLVASGALKKPSELRAPGLCTIMFSDRLPE